MKFKHYLFSVIVGLAVASPSYAQSKGAKGEEVRQICFANQIRNWEILNYNTILVEKSRNEKYVVELLGTCEPRSSFGPLGVISGICIQKGDKVVTDTAWDGFCSIRRMYQWNEVPVPVSP